MNSGIYKVNVSRQQGFTLLEAMLTLFVLTIGVLGVAGLQMQGMRAGGMAMQRTLVLIKTQELFEMMRANRTQTVSDTVIALQEGVIASYATSGAGLNNGCYTGTVCTPVQIVQNDVYFWRADLEAMLPTVTGATQITIQNGATPTEPDIATVTVVWTDKNETLTYSATARI